MHRTLLRGGKSVPHRKQDEVSPLRHTTSGLLGRGTAVIITVVVLGAILTPGPMRADSGSVVVTARVAPTFSLSLLSSGVIDFGTVPLGSTHISADPQIIEVRSNRPWGLTDSSDIVIVIGEITMERDRILRHEGTMAFGTDLPAGVHTIEYTYTLDLATPAAFDIPPDTEISATFGYTAIQR